ncbi:hypothetical protein I4U23_027467 [Adineta vaga]|nr:hypothetical protein I4U23_027467 [Adineta vaga]
MDHQLCIMKYDAWSGYQYTSPFPFCYNSLYQACLNNTLCNSLSQVCNGRCMGYNQVCVNNVSVCNVTFNYYNYQPDQIKLCNGVCYDSAIQQCVGEHSVNCIRDPFTQESIGENTNYTHTHTLKNLCCPISTARW